MSDATNVKQEFSSWRYSSSTVAETIIYTQINDFDLLQIYKTDELAASKNNFFKKIETSDFLCAVSDSIGSDGRG